MASAEGDAMSQIKPGGSEMTKPTPRKMRQTKGIGNGFVHNEDDECKQWGCVPVEPQEPSRSVQRRVAIQKGEPMPTFEPQEPGMEPALTEEIRADEQVKHMVERFLGWKLPDNFSPDGGISFTKMYNEHTSHPMKHEPVGTNLFDYTQAEQMVRYMLAEEDNHEAVECMLTCDMCDGADIYTRYHANQWACAYGDHNKRNIEHLHRYCRGCGYDWCDPTNKGAITEAGKEKKA